MKHELETIFTASVASLLTFTALAQDPSTAKADRPNHPRDRLLHAQRADRLNGAARASDLLGMTVKNYQEEKLGKVEDIGVDVESGRVVQVIISTGGFLGIGDTLTAVPPGALNHDSAHKVLHLEANKEKLIGAPRFDPSRWSEGSDSNHLSAVYTYYGEEPSFRFLHRGDAALDGLRDPGGRIITGTQPAPEGQVKAGESSNPPDALKRDLNQEGDDAWNKSRALKERQSLIPISRLSQLQKASKLLGTSVKNLQNEMLGKVEDLLVDLSAGRILAVVVSAGHVLGTVGDFSAVPPTALWFNNERDILQLDASKESLAIAPHFKSTEWPDFGQPSYAAGIYRAYKMEPYFNTNSTQELDNSAQNVRDRYNRSLTPLDQGNSKADINITAQIRKEITAAKDMSVNAKNVKIITNQGRVTLRGPVNSAEEKRFIGDIAGRIARSDNVDNQLEVKRTISADE